MLDSAIEPLLAARGVVAFAHVDWSGTWYSRHQILSRLARICPVVVVDHPVDARDALAGRIPRRPVLETVAPNLWTYRPPRWLPEAYRPPAAKRLLDTQRARHLAASIRRLASSYPSANRV